MNNKTKEKKRTIRKIQYYLMSFLTLLLVLLNYLPNGELQYLSIFLLNLWISLGLIISIVNWIVLLSVMYYKVKYPLLNPVAYFPALRKRFLYHLKININNFTWLSLYYKIIIISLIITLIQIGYDQIGYMLITQLVLIHGYLFSLKYLNNCFHFVTIRHH